jgi:hypothetical protein
VRPVKVSQQGNGKAVVTEGLTPGQKVVVSGQSRLQKGTLIQPKQAAPKDNKLSSSTPPQIAQTPAGPAPPAKPPENGD